MQGHSRAVTSVAFSPDGNTLATGSWDNAARLWDVRTGKCVGVPLQVRPLCVSACVPELCQSSRLVLLLLLQLAGFFFEFTRG